MAFVFVFICIGGTPLRLESQVWTSESFKLQLTVLMYVSSASETTLHTLSPISTYTYAIARTWPFKRAVYSKASFDEKLLSDVVSTPYEWEHLILTYRLGGSRRLEPNCFKPPEPSPRRGAAWRP